MINAADEIALNSLIREYLDFAEYRDTITVFDEDCKTRGRMPQQVAQASSANGDVKLREIESQLLQAFTAGDRVFFFQLWDQYFPYESKRHDSSYLKLDFYLNIYFAVFPLHDSVDRAAAERKSMNESMDIFKQYLETRGSELSRTNEFLPFYALPYVPDPRFHPSFRDIFSSTWVSDLSGRLMLFLNRHLKSSIEPRILSLIHSNGTTEITGDIHLHKQLKTAEERISVLVSRHRNLQTDYHNLITIASELVQALATVLNGGHITPVYLANICQRLAAFRRGSTSSVTSPVVNNMPQHQKAMNYSRPPLPPSPLPPKQMEPQTPLPTETMSYPSRPRNLTEEPRRLDYDLIHRDLGGMEEKKKCFLLHALRNRVLEGPINGKRGIIKEYKMMDVLGFNSAEQVFNTLLLTGNSKDQLAKFLNILASTCVGREYLLTFSSLIPSLVQELTSTTDESVYRQNVLGTLQKLSLRRSAQSAMNDLGVVGYLHDLLVGYGGLSEYTLEYGCSLMMNLCLRTKGKSQCLSHPDKTLALLRELCSHPNVQVRTYSNGTLMSVLSDKAMKAKAREMGLDRDLQALQSSSEDTLAAQIDFVLEQLADNPEEGPTEAADQEDTVSEDGQEEDFEDPAEEDDIDAAIEEQEIIHPLASASDLVGDVLLSSYYSTSKPLHIAHHPKTLHHPRRLQNGSISGQMAAIVMSPAAPPEPLVHTRPTTPARHSSNALRKSVQHLNAALEKVGLGNLAGNDKVQAVIKPPPPKDKTLEAIKRQRQQTGEPDRTNDDDVEEYFSAFTTRPKVPRTPIDGRPSGTADNMYI